MVRWSPCRSAGVGPGRVVARGFVWVWRVRVRWGLVAQFPAPLKKQGLRPCFFAFQGRGELREQPQRTRTRQRTPPPSSPAPGGRRGAAPGDGTGRGGGGENR